MHRYFLLVLLLASCDNDGADLDKARKEILAIHANQKTYHVNKDAKKFTDMQSEQFLSINAGTIEQPSRQNSFQMFDQYFKAVEFVKWDDKRPPIIRFSDDASVAYVAVES